jgi:hypothetical protein
LKYVNDPLSAKVRRWKLAIQDYDFNIEHIKGEANIAADAFSRLLPTPADHILTVVDIQIPTDKFHQIAKVHNSIIGHHGVDRTMAKLKLLKHDWTYMREHVRRFIHVHCPCCQKMNILRTPIHSHPFTLSTYEPMERLYIDTLSFEQDDIAGYKHAIVVIDGFTRWIEIYPIADLSAKTAASRLLEHFGRYGIPTQVYSDNGTQFCNDLHRELYKLTGIEQVLTVPYSKEENGIVERANREVTRHVRAILFDKELGNEWSQTIPFVQRILNSETHQSTGVSPVKLLFGNAINLDRCLYGDHTSNIKDLQLSTWSAQQLRLQQQTIRAAQLYQKARDESHISQYQTMRTKFVPGQHVLCDYTGNPIKHGASNKLRTQLRGPYKVISCIKNDVKLMDLITSKEFTINIQHVRPFTYDPMITNPFHIARRDRAEYVVENILDHHGQSSRRSDLEFLVKWKDYDEAENSWEPYKELKDIPALHNYLYNHKMKSLIPPEHRKDKFR